MPGLLRDLIALEVELAPGPGEPTPAEYRGRFPGQAAEVGRRLRRDLTGAGGRTSAIEPEPPGHRRQPPLRPAGPPEQLHRPRCPAGAFNSWCADRSRRLGEILRGARRLSRRAATRSWRRWSRSTSGSTATTRRGAWRPSARSARSRRRCPGSPTPTSRPASPASPTAPATGTTTRPDRQLRRRGRASTSAGTRFRILRPHARGGLGEVFVALDTELNRDVALKEIQAQFADDPRHRARFEFEAEVTGGLEHPGIVPVYGLGHTPDGRPYYAMRFIRGDSLKEAIRRFHQAERAARSRSGPERAGIARVAGPVHRRLRRDRLCPQPRGAAPRPEAGQHHAGQVRRDAGGRLGPGQGARAAASPSGRSGGRSCR